MQQKKIGTKIFSLFSIETNEDMLTKFSPADENPTWRNTPKISFHFLYPFLFISLLFFRNEPSENPLANPTSMVLDSVVKLLPVSLVSETERPKGSLILNLWLLKNLKK